MVYNILSFNGSFHQICYQLADELHLSVSYVCHYVFLELYKRDIKTAISFFVESDLFSFLINGKGEFDLVPAEGGEQIKFKDGSTVGPDVSTWTWEQFFRLFYMEYSEDRRQLLIDRIIKHLENHSAEYAGGPFIGITDVPQPVAIRSNKRIL